MPLIEHLQGVTLDSFLADHPEVPATMARHAPPLPARIEDPLAVLAAESAYNQNAMSYVCSLGGVIGERSPYRDRFLVQSQVMAAFAIEEGGFAKRGFLDPHSSLRLFMMETLARLLGRTVPSVPYADEAARRMGEIYLWRANVPEVADPYAAMLGAHFASEYLAARQEFPGLLNLFERDQPDLLETLRGQKEPNFGFSAADWLEGHPVVELKHAGYAARAAVAAAYGLDDATAFWASWHVGFEEFCRNDAAYFARLSSR